MALRTTPPVARLSPLVRQCHDAHFRVVNQANDAERKPPQRKAARGASPFGTEHRMQTQQIDAALELCYQRTPEFGVRLLRAKERRLC